ncbi:FAD-binding oxidoreductase [bacterium]|nr:FAD-binding oxidoreductase [bacterium]
MPDGFCERLVFPENEKHISQIMTQAFSTKNGLTISGARTGIVGGAVPMGGTLMSTEKMQNIINVSAGHDHAEVVLQPGVTLDALGHYLSDSQNGWFYPPDPTEKTASIAGTVATNASGARSFKYGQTRHFIQKLRLILSDGTLVEIPRGRYRLEAGKSYRIQGTRCNFYFEMPPFIQRSVKNAAGYFLKPEMDLIDLFIGSEGTLGIISEVTVRLIRKPELQFAAVAFFPKENQAFEFVATIKKTMNNDASFHAPTALEYFDRHSLNLLREVKAGAGQDSGLKAIPPEAAAAIYFEQETAESLLDEVFEQYDRLLEQHGSSMGSTWGATTETERHMLALFRHALPESVNTIIGQRQQYIPELHKISTDFVVPDCNFSVFMKKFHEILAGSGIETVIFGHIGENHLHANIMPKNAEELKQAKSIYLNLANLAIAMDGTISGEHGIGKIKKHLLSAMYSPEDMKKFQNLKQAFDPFSLLQKGVLF